MGLVVKVLSAKQKLVIQDLDLHGKSMDLKETQISIASIEDKSQYQLVKLKPSDRCCVCSFPYAQQNLAEQDNVVSCDDCELHYHPTCTPDDFLDQRRECPECRFKCQRCQVSVDDDFSLLEQVGRWGHFCTPCAVVLKHWKQKQERRKTNHLVSSRLYSGFVIPGRERECLDIRKHVRRSLAQSQPEEEEPRRAGAIVVSSRPGMGKSLVVSSILKTYHFQYQIVSFTVLRNEKPK